MDVWELLCTSLGAIVAVYFGIKLLLFSWMLFPSVWFPLPKSFFPSLGEWAVVTGASEGIGRSYAFALAEKGMNVVIISRTKANLDKVAKEIGDKTGQKIKVLVADFTREDCFAPLEDELKEMNIGVLVNNVGMVMNALPCKFLESENLDQNIIKLINCNVKTMAKMCKIILPGMVNRGKGVIINVSSGVGCVPFPLYTLYSGSKVFVNRFSQGLQAEYKEKGIIIQAVTPFSVSTRMTYHQETSAAVLLPENFVSSSLQYLRVGDRVYGSISHTLMGCLLEKIPDWMLSTNFMQDGLTNFVKNAFSQSSRKSTKNK